MRAWFCALVILCLARPAARGADWPQWRGPLRNGVSAESLDLRRAWSNAAPSILWTQNVGTGFSSISVTEGRAYTMGNTNNEDTVWCFAAESGRELWRHSYASRLDPQYYEGGPTSTPTVHEGRVYTINKWGTVLCLDAVSGKVIWRHDLWQEGIRSNRWGFAGSPVIYKDLVLLNAGQAGTALDRRNGRVIWNNGTNVAGYATPVLFTNDNRVDLLIFASDCLVAADPDTGQEHWRYPFKTSYDTNNTDPLARGNRVFISSFSRGCAMLEIENGQPRLVYANKNLHNHLSPGIVFGEYLYAFNGEAKFTTDFRCFHLLSGEVRWAVKDPKFGSVIAVGNELLMLSETGELIAAHVSPEAFEPLARTRILEGVCWTPPSLANGLLYARNAHGTLVCVDLRPRK